MTLTRDQGDQPRLRSVRIAAGRWAHRAPAGTGRGAARGALPTLALAEQVAATVAGEVRPIDDVRSTTGYRRQVAGQMIARFLYDLIG